MRWAIVCASCVTACGGASEDPPAPLRDCGVWRAGPALLDAREYAPPFLLDDGRVLLIGGHFKGNGTPVDTAEIVDVTANRSTFTGSFLTSRTVVGVGGTVRLHDGRILSASPFPMPGAATVDSEIWDPRSGAWSSTGTMAVGGGPAITLPDGRVLVAGGIDWNVEAPLARAEVWSPATNAWTTLPPMTTARTGHALLALPGSRVLAAFGFAKYPDAPGLGTSEIFDVATGTWGNVAKTAQPHAHQAVLLADGRILAAGGTAESGGYKEEVSTAELYDPSTNAWTATTPMHERRSRFSLTLLANGRILAAGGGQDSAVTSGAEIYDPATRVWTMTKPMSHGRGGQTAIRLRDGDVLIVGGYPGRSTSEVYRPCME